MIALGITLLIVGVVITFAYLILSKAEHGEQLVVILSIVLFSGGFYFVQIGRNEIKPQAIDVYRNKTTLSVTYVDSIPTDSTVVFKNGQK